MMQCRIEINALKKQNKQKKKKHFIIQIYKNWGTKNVLRLPSLKITFKLYLNQYINITLVVRVMWPYKECVLLAHPKTISNVIINNNLPLLLLFFFTKDYYYYILSKIIIIIIIYIYNK